MSVPVRGESGDLPGAMLCPLSAMEKLDLSLAVVGLPGPAESTPRSRASARTGLRSLKICVRGTTADRRGGATD